MGMTSVWELRGGCSWWEEEWDDGTAGEGRRESDHHADLW